MLQMGNKGIRYYIGSFCTYTYWVTVRLITCKRTEKNILELLNTYNKLISRSILSKPVSNYLYRTRKKVVSDSCTAHAQLGCIICAARIPSSGRSGRWVGPWCARTTGPGNPRRSWSAPRNIFFCVTWIRLYRGWQEKNSVADPDCGLYFFLPPISW